MPNDTGATPGTDDPTRYKKLAAVLREQISDGTYERWTAWQAKDS
jgi:hypothetical protein